MQRSEAPACRRVWGWLEVSCLLLEMTSTDLRACEWERESWQTLEPKEQNREDVHLLYPLCFQQGRFKTRLPIVIV